MNRFVRSLAVLLLLALPLSAGSLTINTASGGTLTVTLTAAQERIVALRISQLATQGLAFADAPTWIRDFLLVPTFQRERAVAEAAAASGVFDPANALAVAPTPRCTAVGLAAGCTYGAIRDAICGGLGASVGCRPQ